MTSVICRISPDRARKFAACSGVSAKASQTLLKLWIVLLMSPSPEFSVSRSRQLEVALARGPGFLLKRMQHVDGFSEASDVDHAIRTGVIPHSEFLNSFSNRRHRFEIGWLLAVLDLFQLVSRIIPRVFRKLSETLQRVSEEAQRFHGSIIPIWIYDDKPKKMRSSDRLKGTEFGVMQRAPSLGL